MAALKLPAAGEAIAEVQNGFARDKKPPAEAPDRPVAGYGGVSSERSAGARVLIGRQNVATSSSQAGWAYQRADVCRYPENSLYGLPWTRLGLVRSRPLQG